MTRSRILACLAAGAIGVYAGLESSYLLPLDHEAIQYATRPLGDPVTQLDKKLQSGAAKLTYNPDHGYLPSVLKELGVPESSQVLVFSKTSFQAARIGPKMPRAIYFNDKVAVGWVRGGDVIELSAFDPQQGTIFFTLDQDPANPNIQRRDECLQCHVAGRTLGIPGNMVRSVYPDASGMPLTQAGSHVTDHRSPLKERWGGWYVTGKSAPHMGNSTAKGRRGEEIENFDGSDVTDLKTYFDSGAYLTPHSDIVALMVLEHQTRMQNLLTRVAFDTRMALFRQQALGFLQPGELAGSTKAVIGSGGEELVRYMLYGEEAPLDEPVVGTSPFAEEFARSAPRDKQGRSLYDLDLQKRMFKHPCSYLIYSESFDRLPAPARDFILKRMWDVLNAKEPPKDYAHLTAKDRQAILEIVRQTKTGLPDYWQ